MTVIQAQNTNSGLSETHNDHNERHYHELTAPTPAKRTPLPKFQLFIVAMLQFSEPITATVIYPFINKFVRDTGVIQGDERKTGFYAGIIESMFFAAEALTVVYWGRASDYFGRRPILLIGPVGLALSMVGFGLSTNYWSLVVFRCMQGTFNGNIGVSKVVVAEITDSTNVAHAYAVLPIVWTSGSALGPIIGGLLSQPAKRWPNLFQKFIFFHQFPYYLPCVVSALIALVSSLFGFIGLKETLPSAVLRKKKRIVGKEQRATPDCTTSLLSGNNEQGYCSTTSTTSTIETAEPEDDLKDLVPPPLLSLLTPPVQLTLLIHGFMSFSEMSLQVLQPLIYSTSISLGGLGFDPKRIGLIMGTWGVVNIFFTLTCVPMLLQKFGARKIQILTHLSFASTLALYPILSYLVRRAGGADALVWAVMIIQLTFALITSASYASIYVLYLQGISNRASLGAINGMAHAVGCITRAIAPTVASSLFSISLKRHLAGGNMVFLILLGISVIGLRLTFLLPKRPIVD
ncbi:Protein ZINC INDUCED FACILITATOR-LIKE 1 [Termitomyces sp. T112]|nr:Protein ZINC INDUCED FACILITATOR-LIKE 1 [Termitomyces sp. T112]